MGEISSQDLYSFDLDNEKNVFYVKVSGYIKEEDAKIYLSEFQTIVNTINPCKFTLIVDGRGQEEVPSHVVDDISFVLNLYWMAGFKMLIIVLPTSPTSREQVEVCAEKINFRGLFVNSVGEAFNIHKAIK